MDLFDGVLGGSLYSQLVGLSGLQANTDQRLTSTTDRLTALEHRYERMQLVMLGLWTLLKEHNGLTDADLKHFMHGGAVALAGSAGRKTTEGAAPPPGEAEHRFIVKNRLQRTVQRG